MCFTGARRPSALLQTKPDGSQTQTAYAGNTVTVTDPAGKFKSYTYDAAGGLVFVSEPGPSTGGNPYAYTYYTLNAAGQIVWAGVQRSGAQQNHYYTWSGTDLIGSNDPETGTTTYQYDGNHHVTQRVDAKGQQTNYIYDAYERLIEVKHYAAPTCQSCQAQEQVNQRVFYTYDVNPLNPGNYTNSWGRLTGVSFQQQTGEGPPFDKLFAYYYSYNQAGRVTANTFQAASPDGSTMLANLAANYAWDNQGRMTNMTYPSGTQLAYQYDAMGRLSGITSPNVPSLYQAVSATYTGTGQLSTLSYGTSYGLTNVETRSYNSLMQLTRMTTVNNQTVMDMQYNYTAGQNNGRVASTTDNVLGETVNYTYDYWNRLTSAVATNGNWGENYTYDGFGNLTGKTPTAGTAPALNLPSNLATNQTAGAAYDANGNPSPVYPVTGIPGYTWDVENRLVNVVSTTVGTVHYSYDPWGRRIWTEMPGAPGATPTGEIYFYGVTGQKLETYSFSNGSSFSASLEGINVYFGGKLLQSKGAWVVTDKLGSVRWNANLGAINYWPYGEERTSTGNGVEKFATYTRDAVGQDYADQRYYNASVGAFWTPDPGGFTTANPRNPSSWNRYAYVLGDPVNHTDRRGLYVDAEDCANNPDECSNCLPGTSFWGQPPGCDDDEGGGGRTAGGDDSDGASPDCLSGFASFMVGFVTTDYTASVTLATEAGIPQDWILAWSADESSFGTSSIAKKSGNYFGWHGSGNVKCPTGTNAITGCFSSFLASGTTALFSEHTWLNYNGNPRSSAGQILFNQFQGGASAATAFQALSNAGYNSNKNYGAQVAGSYFLGNVDAIENCLSSLGKLQ